MTFLIGIRGIIESLPTLIHGGPCYLASAVEHVPLPAGRQGRGVYARIAFDLGAPRSTLLCRAAAVRLRRILTCPTPSLSRSSHESALAKPEARLATGHTGYNYSSFLKTCLGWGRVTLLDSGHDEIQQLGMNPQTRGNGERKIRIG